MTDRLDELAQFVVFAALVLGKRSDDFATAITRDLAFRFTLRPTPGNAPAEKQAYLVRTAWESTYSSPERIGDLLIIKNFLNNYELMTSARAMPYLPAKTHWL